MATTNNITTNVITFQKLVGTTNVTVFAPSKLPTGPLVNITNQENSEYPFLVTVLAYIPADRTLQPVTKDTSGDDLFNGLIYLNYKGVENVTVENAGGTEIVTGRTFYVEYKCNEGSQNFDTYYLQFEYKINSGDFADVIFICDDNEDPVTDRGTTSNPIRPRNNTKK